MKEKLRGMWFTDAQEAVPPYEKGVKATPKLKPTLAQTLCFSFRGSYLLEPSQSESSAVNVRHHPRNVEVPSRRLVLETRSKCFKLKTHWSILTWSGFELGVLRLESSDLNRWITIAPLKKFVVAITSDDALKLKRCL
ncbi:hypothetical protein EVAR_47315_1 [Eumeta japonica]|uniref:Uncharacterized protein n=1 Tax=Eumeta variegata TaxID=151549 RepID=A0A4C1YGS8_EUMVA|nr:hypothetical protein EVAR_47315_1 [Eumeta japonica]